MSLLNEEDEEKIGKKGVTFSYAAEPPHISDFEIIKPQCTICNRTGHTAENCFYEKCQICQDRGHYTQNCPRLQKTEKNCQLCNNKGHKATSCYKNPRNTKCQLCDKDGHEAKEFQEQT